MTIMLELLYLTSKLSFLSPLPKKEILESVCKNLQRVGCSGRGREGTPGAMSHPDILGRSSLRYAVMSMRNTSKCACVIQEVF